jgi:hypothetical protein
MRGILAIVGILMICGGISAITNDVISGAVGASQRAIDIATTDPKTLCDDGETLEQDRSMSTYRQGQGYASAVSYYCVNAEGVRRDVTGEFAESMLGEVSQLFGSALNFRREWLFLMGGGVVVLVLAALIRRRRPDTDLISGQGMGSPVTTVNGQPVRFSGSLGDAIQQSIAIAREQQAARGTSASLSDKLRQLETARSNGLITESEYQSARQKLLDDMT